MKYHDKRYPHTVCVRLTKEQYNKVKPNVSETIRKIIDETNSKKSRLDY